MSAGQSLDRGRAALLALAVAVALAAGGAAAQTPTTLLGISIPDRVAGLSHLAPIDFEKDSPGMGYGIRFPSSDWTIDVYIYDLRMKSIPDDPNSAAVQSALSEAKDEIAEIAKRGDYQNVRLKDTLNIADAAGHARASTSTAISVSPVSGASFSRSAWTRQKTPLQPMTRAVS
jgi:hypothetical protein